MCNRRGESYRASVPLGVIPPCFLSLPFAVCVFVSPTDQTKLACHTCCIERVGTSEGRGEESGRNGGREGNDARICGQSHACATVSSHLIVCLARCRLCCVLRACLRLWHVFPLRSYLGLDRRWQRRLHACAQRLVVRCAAPLRSSLVVFGLCGRSIVCVCVVCASIRDPSAVPARRCVSETMPSNLGCDDGSAILTALVSRVS